MAEHHAPPTFEFNPEVDVPAAVYVSQLWLYSLAVLYPVQAAKRLGMFAKTSIGKYPLAAQSGGAGQSYCLEYRGPVYLDREPENLQSVGEFDRGARLYETVVAPFTRPVHQEALVLIRRLLPDAAKILDLGCGPGVELCRLSELFPKGEVVGVDLSAEMIAAAHRTAKERGRSNTSLFQADVTKLPKHFAERFDAVHCSFAFHHYSHPLAALSEMHRVLAPDGKAFVIDGGTLWANTLSAPFAKWGDPGWVGFHTGGEFQSMFRRAGFSEFYWEELLPGIGICVGTK